MIEKKFNTYIGDNDYLLLYFYPKDNTPWCSLEARDFSFFQKEFLSMGIAILGVSKDSKESHEKFIQKQNLTIPLLSDESLAIHNEFAIIGEKKNYWKVYQGVIRSTFLLNKKWEIVKERRNVRAKGHVERVLRCIKEEKLIEKI